MDKIKLQELLDDYHSDVYQILDEMEINTDAKDVIENYIQQLFGKLFKLQEDLEKSFGIGVG